MSFVISKKLFKNKFIIAIMLLAVVAGLRYRSMNSEESTKYILAAVERNTLVSSVSGSGQVVVAEEIDIKPKISGDIAAVYIAKGQDVWKGQLVASLDSEDAQRDVRDAQNSLDEAKRNLDEAEEDYQDVETDSASSLESSYEDAYSSVSTAFFKLSDYIKDLRDVLGTEASDREYISGYNLVTGIDSVFTQRLIEDYEEANELFNENFTFFRSVFQNDDSVTIYELLSDTIETAKAMSKALESARHLYDAVTVNDYYKNFTIASHVDEMQPKIESDVSSVYSQVSSLQKVKDDIDDVNDNAPENVKDAQLAVESAQNLVVQKEEALADAQEKLSQCNIYAPFSGSISYVSEVKKGDSVSSASTLATLITKEKLVEINFNEIDAAKLKTGQRVTVTFDALPDLSISGKVIDVDVSGTVSQGVVSYGVKIGLDVYNDQVKAGMSATADIVTDVRQNVLIVPNSAVKAQGDTYYVEVVDMEEEDSSRQLLSSVSAVDLPQSPEIQIVETGLSNDTSTEIISGLEEGSVVVYSKLNSSKTQTSSQTQNTGFQMRTGAFR